MFLLPFGSLISHFRDLQAWFPDQSLHRILEEQLLFHKVKIEQGAILCILLFKDMEYSIYN